MSAMKILLIEDNLDHEEIIVSTANQAFGENVSISCERQFYPGLERLNVDPFDILLCDLALPDSNLRNTAEHLELLETHVPIVVLTSLNNEELACELIASGIQDYLPKDKLTAELFTRTIRYAIERKKSILHVEKSRRDQLAICLALGKNFKKPIRNINFLINSLYEKFDQINVLDQNDREIFGAVNAHLSSLKTVTDDYYCYLSLQECSEEKTNCTLCDSISDAVTRLSAPSDFMSIGAIDINYNLYGIKTLISELFYRLLKFILSYSDSTVKANITAEKTADDKLRLDVIDTNKPLKPQHLLGLMQRFDAEIVNGTKSVSGVDIAIAKSIMELHGGRLTITPCKEEGNTYSLLFPAESIR